MSDPYSQASININTIEKFAKLWTRNLIKNIDTIASSPGVSYLRNFHKNQPSLIINSGPSLEETLEYIHLLKDKLIIIAVDSSLRALQRKRALNKHENSEKRAFGPRERETAGELAIGGEGLLEKALVLRQRDPDYLVISDAQLENAKHLWRIAPTKAIVVADSAIYPGTFRALSNPVYLVSSYFPLGKLFELRIGEKGNLSVGGSVSTTAYALADLLGCSPIYMAGLDHGYPGGETHFKGAMSETVYLNRSNRLWPYYTQSLSEVLGGAPYWTDSNSPFCVVQTDHRFRVYREWFKKVVAYKDSAPTFNLGPRSAAIEGVKYKHVSELLGLPNIKKEVPHFELSPSVVEANKRAIRDELKLVKKDAEDMLRCRQADDILDIPYRHIFGMLAQRAIEDYMQGGKGDLLKSMQKSAEWLIKELKKAD
ncbi:MAG: 6-hydroxymethylpterin diphosphokinase MptE-like protein [Pseudomonadota bacterium]